MWLLTLTSFVVLFTAKLALPRLSSDTQRYHSPISIGGESNSSVPSRSSVQLLPVQAFGWRGSTSRHFRHLPRPSPHWSMPASAQVFSCGRATAPHVVRSPVHLPQDLSQDPTVLLNSPLRRSDDAFGSRGWSSRSRQLAYLPPGSRRFAYAFSRSS